MPSFLKRETRNRWKHWSEYSSTCLCCSKLDLKRSLAWCVRVRVRVRATIRHGDDKTRFAAPQQFNRQIGTSFPRSSIFVFLLFGLSFYFVHRSKCLQNLYEISLENGWRITASKKLMQRDAVHCALWLDGPQLSASSCPDDKHREK